MALGKKKGRKKKRKPGRSPRLQPSVATDSHSPEMVTLKAESTQGYVVRTRALRFPAPMVDQAQNPKAFEYWWSQLGFVFDLEDPSLGVPVDRLLNADEERVLQRYVATAKILARSALLSASDRVTFSVAGPSEKGSVEASFSAPDQVAGFAAYFRQLYDNDEPASFQRAMAILLDPLGSRGASVVNETALRRWSFAVRELHRKPMELLILESLSEVGEWSPLSDTDRLGFADQRPERIISQYLYGDAIHWGKHAEVLEERKLSEFEDARMRMSFLEATAALGHVYIGFAVLVEATFGWAAHDGGR